MLRFSAMSCFSASRAKLDSTAKPSSSKPLWHWTEIKLGELPESAGVVGQPFIDEHGWNYGVVVQTPGGRSLWLNGTNGAVFDDFVEAHVADAGLVFSYAFSPDGERCAYAVRHHGKMHMVIDGQPSPPEDAVEYPLFSPDGRHLAYEVERKGKWYLLLDGVPGPPCDNVGGPIEFSPDGQRIVYQARHGKKFCMVVDQKERPDWPGSGFAVFSPDSRHLLYINHDGAAVLDGVKGTNHPHRSYSGPAFSSDSRHFAYSIENTRKRAFVDWEPLTLPEDGTGVFYVKFGPDLKRWGCIIQRENHRQVFVDGHYEPLFKSAWGLVFSSNGSRYAYLAQTETNWFMVVDGKVEADITINASSPCFSPNGKRLAYIAGHGPVWWMMVDGKPGPKYQGPRGPGRIFEPGEIDLPALTQPQFSPDSAHVVYGFYEKGKWFVSADNTRFGIGYESIIQGGPCFHQDGTVDCLGVRKGALYRISAKPASRVP